MASPSFRFPRSGPRRPPWTPRSAREGDARPPHHRKQVEELQSSAQDDRHDLEHRAPLLNRRLAGFGTTIFAEMSALAARTGVDQPRAGLPRHRRAPEVLGGGRARPCATARQPVPAGPRHPRAAHRDRRAPAAALRPRPRPGHRGAGHRRRHRGHRRRAARAVRAGRRGHRLRAVLRLLRRLHRDGRRGARVPVTLRAARGPLRASTSTSCAPRSPPRPACCCSTPRTTRPARCSPARSSPRSPSCASSTTCSWSPTRCTSTWSSTAPSTCRWPRFPGMRERTVTISSAGKTFSFTGWKVGWVTAARPSWSRRSARRSSSSRTSRRARSSTRSPSALRAARRLLRRLPRDLRPSATCWRRA